MKLSVQAQLLAILFLLAFQSQVLSQSEEPSGLLGDHFSLESALEIFKESKSLKDFEEAMNKEDNHVHNLDLNGDEKIDYITVNDYMDGNVHAIAISAIINKDESQDIAVIEIEKTGEESATLQIVGDVDMYGEDMIVEPFDVEESSEGRGPNANMEFERIVFNVWLWPSVRYVYGPSYVVYHSPWSWSYYPVWWNPWRPRAWSVWRPYRVRFGPRYRITPVRRVTHARVVYAPQRRVSRTVNVRHTTSISKARTTKASTRKSSTRVAAAKTKDGKAVAVKKSNTRVTKANGVSKSKSTTKVKATKGNKKVKASKKTKTTKAKKTTKGKKTTKAKKGKKKTTKKKKSVRKKKGS